MQLTREAISRAALGILDEYGLADVSMRRVASSLGVAPGALYWHIENKQELISDMAQLIVAPLAEAAPTSPENTCGALRSALLAHRDGAEVVITAVSQASSPVRTVLTAAMAGAVRDAAAEAADHDRLAAAEGLMYLTLGAAYVQQSSAQLSEATGADSGTDVRPDGVELAIGFLLRGLPRGRRK